MPSLFSVGLFAAFDSADAVSVPNVSNRSLHTKALSQASPLLRSTFFRAAVKEKSFRGSSQNIYEFFCVSFDDRKKSRGKPNLPTSSAGPRRFDSAASTRSWRSSEPQKPVQKFRNERAERQGYPDGSDGEDFRDASHDGSQRSHDKAAARRTERPRGRGSSSQSVDFTPGAQPAARRSWRSAEPRRAPRTRNPRPYESDNDQEEWNPRNRRAKETLGATRSEELDETEEDKSRPPPTKFVEDLLPSASTSRVLLGLSASELSLWAQAHGLEAYRGKQIHQYLYEKGARSLSSIPVLSKAWRDSDAASFPIGRSSIAHESIAPDGTRKFLLSLEDGKQIECVGIPTRDRLTVCVSTQVGCAMKCDFCATGKMGFTRDLSVAEIVDQVLTVQESAQRRVSHIVFMGMGEPLNNLTNVLQAVHVLNKDVGIGQRNMTISTVGIQGRIQELAQYQLQCTLAVSLHAPTQQLREAIIPSAKAYTYDMLINDCKLYVQATGRRISFEYTVLSGVNDASEHAIELAKRLRGFQCHVNLIPYNPISDSEYVRPSGDRLAKFLDVLQNHNIAASVRRTRGLDSDAACGQLTSSARQSRAAQR